MPRKLGFSDVPSKLGFKGVPSKFVFRGAKRGLALDVPIKVGLYGDSK